MKRHILASLAALLIPLAAIAADRGNRLTYLDDGANPYYVGLDTPKLVTPQWVGQKGVEAVIVLAIDDMTRAERYEQFLRPILKRLKQIDGRGPVSIMTRSIDPQLPRLQQWLDEGLSIETHTYSHPCPCLQAGKLADAKATFDRCVDLLSRIPHTRPVAFRMPCCDSMNSVSPRFFTEVFNKTTPGGRFLTMDSSVFLLFTPDDPALPRRLVLDEGGREKFRKYVPADRLMVNYVENYPYPFVIGRLCWEFPCVMPSDWDAQHRNGKCSPITVRDLKAAIDAAVVKQGVFSLCFHPHGWIRNDQVIELIDYAASRYGRKVQFLTFREVQARLERNLLAGHPLRGPRGRDNGVRVCDVNNDGYMDVIIGNRAARTTRIWSPKTHTWRSAPLPVELVAQSPQGSPTGVRFGVLQKSGCASLLVRNDEVAGLWHFDGQAWAGDPRGLRGLELNGPVFTQRGTRDQGVRLHDLDRDGVCELLVGNPRQNGVFAWRGDGWQRLPDRLPDGLWIADAEGRDAGLRLVDLDEDGFDDLVFSNARRCAAYLLTPPARGWSRKMFDAERRGEPSELPMIVRADGTNNGAWFKYRHMWVQNEDTGKVLPYHVAHRYYTDDLLAAEKEPPPRSPQSAWRSLIPRSGFRVELMAWEPMVMDPVDIAWGPDGKLWVVEMADYPMGLDDRGKPGGRIRFLEDTDGDGHYDRSTVFLEPVAFPTGVMPWRDGVLVTAAPTVFYAEDTDGDGRADLRKTLLDGFHEGNQQHRVNHPRWGLDNWVHVANGDSDGLIRSLATGQVVDISGRDLRFQPDTGRLDPETGRTQFGRNRDDWGNWFGCNNNNPGWHYVLVDRYIRRNPHLAAPAGKVDLTQLRDVYPAGRVMTHCFFDQPTPPEGQPGRWTSVAGGMVYRDELLGPQLAGNYFVADSVYNVVHRMVLTFDGIQIRGRRALDEQQSEFLASADPWFRPTTLHTGPDGALWVVDMYRYVIEHPQWIDDRLEKRLQLRRGHDRGRIYRIYPVDRTPRPIPRLDRLDTAGLVAALDSLNGWQRDMAQQLLVWRGDRAAVAPLEKMVSGHPRPLARLHALCTLDGLGAVRPEIAIRALEDPHPGVRRHAVRVSEKLLGTSEALGEAILRRLDDPDRQVQLQLAWSLGQWKDARAGRALAQLALRHAEHPYLMAAVMSSAVPHVQTMLAEVRSLGAPAALAQKLAKLADDVRSHPVRAAGVETARRAPLARPAAGPINAKTSPQRQAALDHYSAAVNLPGDPVRGKQIFVEATCSLCHRLEDVGENIGPDIRTLVDRSPQNLLVAILDPNRAVKERFVEYRVLTVDGRVYSGMLLQQTGNSITLANNQGKKITILRRDLEQLVPTRRSFMGEGLESSLSLQQMADLLAFLGKAGSPRKRFAGNEPTTVLADRDRAIWLSADRAELYGPEITFDRQRQCIASWTRAEAYVVWTMHLTRRQRFDVWVQWACPGKAAGNRFLVEVGSQTIAGQVPTTGGARSYRWEKVGRLVLDAGTHRIGFRSDGPIAGPLVHLRGIKLTPPGHPPEAAVASRGSAPQPEVITPDPDGSIQLLAAKGHGIGPKIKYQPKQQSFGWFSAADRVQWDLQVTEPGDYDAWLVWSVDDENAGKPWDLHVGDQRLIGVAGRTGGWETYRQMRIGRIELGAGNYRAVFRPASGFEGYLLDLREIRLVPVARSK